MIWDNLKLSSGCPVSRQIMDYIRNLIMNGSLHEGLLLPSTRELARILKVSRSAVIIAYEELQNQQLIQNVQGRGAFVSAINNKKEKTPVVDWMKRVNEYGKTALNLIQTSRQYPWKKGIISFNSLAPDDSIFEVEEVKRAFLNRIALEGGKLLNYGETKGYRPLIDWLKRYLQAKGVDFQGKDILITNGFTESFALVLAALTEPGDNIICENPTHNLALNAMKLAGLKITGIQMSQDGLDLQQLEEALTAKTAKLGFIMPSYHNPTGLVMSPDKRLKVLELFEKYQLPLVEEGFNEELRYSGSHVSPLIALAGTANHLIYLGSFAKILFPAIRTGWVIGDAGLITCLESIKLYRNLYTSLLDQAVLYDYLQNGKFQQYLKRAKKLYKEKYEQAIKLAKTHIPCRRLWGDGGLHLFIELDGVDTRRLLAYCYQRGVLFTPGEIFYCDGTGSNTFRLSISRVDSQEMERGLIIIGEGIRELNQSPIPI
ncbi:MAG: PLP-dependent aminotransferase family protein [Bacillota bacterium]